ncbi:uncharacterized protein [Miscanthus floridulus]|uniref:uncharacterized protein isoform X2 n=1 Tax=Miscanthus floridulus TaxID=154761 RepID=UPI0034595F22
MATRSALASLPARLRPTSAATAAGGWRRLLSDDPTKGSMENTLKDEDKRLEDPTMMDGLPMESSAHPGLAENEKNSLKDQLEQSRKEMKQLKDQLEKAESEKQQLKNQIHKAENENCLRDQLEQSKKEIKELKDQLEKAEAEKQLLKDQTHKDLETIVSKQTVEFGTKLANHGIHVDECIRKLRHRLEEFKAGVMVDVVFLKEECLERAAVGQEGTEVLEEKNLKFQDDLIGKVQPTQYNVVKTTAIAAVVLVAVVFVVLHVKRG